MILLPCQNGKFRDVNVMTLGNNLKKAREKKGLTQDELGKLINVSDATINRYENEKRRPDPETLKQLAVHLEVSTDVLLGKEMPLLNALKSFGDKTIADWFKSLPSDIQDFLKSNDSVAWIKMAKNLKESGYSIELIIEWISALSITISEMIKKNELPGNGFIVAAEKRDGEYTEEQKQVIAGQFQNRLNDPKFKSPWKKP